MRPVATEGHAACWPETVMPREPMRAAAPLTAGTA